MATELTAEQARRICVPEKDFLHPFTSTDDLPELDEILGQERATRAIEFGLGIPSYGYNIIVLGQVGLGKTTALTSFLEARAPSQPVPSDWCYVADVNDPYRPRALRLSAGVAVPFRDAVDSALKGIAGAVAKAFDSESYDEARSRVAKEMEAARNAMYEEIQAVVVKAGFALVQGTSGVSIVPAQRGQPLTVDQLSQMTPAAKDDLKTRQAAVQDEMEKSLFKVRELERTAHARLDQIDHDLVASTITPFLDDLQKGFATQAEALRHIAAMQADLIARADALHADAAPPPASDGSAPPVHPSPYTRYRVNVMVDNGSTVGAPVVVELNATISNIMGRVGQRMENGDWLADQMSIRPGALHRANGGYLVVDGRTLVRNPIIWALFKRALRTTEIRLDDLPSDQLMVTPVTLAPEPIPLAVKVVLVADAETYYDLYQDDEEFQKLFKVRADFGPDMPWTPENALKLAQLIHSRTKEEGLIPMSAPAVAKVVEYCARLVEDQGKLTTRQALISDLVRETCYWAVTAEHSTVQAEDVVRAIKEKVDRSNLMEERMQELITNAQIMVETSGKAVGQVNALSVMVYGDYSFGLPAWVTARVYPGRGGVINIEREAKMSGNIHDKGVLILAGYLAGTYASTAPLGFSASIAFEQSYSGVDGDSASSTELYALISALSGVALRQELAVTGSVNQQGQVQAIGGVNAKIEGFYDVCRAKGGLTGTQGVVIPQANVKDLMLREDVVAALSEGRFHIYSVTTIDEGLELLTGRQVGARQADGAYPDASVSFLVQQRFAQLSQAVRGFGGDT